MDKPTLRRAILGIVADASPAPCNLERLAQGILLRCGVRMDPQGIAAECRELETAGYLINLKHSMDPVYKGITAHARIQLDMAGVLDALLWGDAAL
jgi:hypothetical protein